ncbi:cobalamin biosynthesis protein CobW [Marinomonas sp. GJ51-6]|uniref:cobalamin biosynthesis protein CobW n=1 Tax=Marinomonas sp. GJ51-6 TaxID=2992802 RepID=UPI0029346631|nr:cobalamin biosynthesis protein CobW [Marinomonas sp. GJ51-6]WOD09331.1 cobalamin biosynthesis protein CobW [Marinomonas sp. GJ51-6]
MQLNKIPTTIVTGFLGSGKTTLLSNVLKQAAGKRIAVIVNEFGELDIDSELLRSCPLDCDDEQESGQRSDDGFYELANGCICCTVEEEFLPVMEQLVARRGDIDHILIETSGLALPKPLVQAFNWPGIKEHCTVDAVITVVDGAAVAAGRFAHDENKVQAQREADDSLDHDPSLQELLDDQLSAADLVVVTKNDLLDDEARTRVQSIIRHEVPKSVKTTYIENGEVALDALLGIDAATESRIDEVHNHHDHHHAHGEHHDHAHDHFDSFVVSLGEVQSDLLQETLSQLLEEHNIFRIKGFAAVHGKPMRQVFQAVGKRLDRYFDRLWQADEIRQTQLVFIGKCISKEQIEGILHDALSA